MKSLNRNNFFFFCMFFCDFCLLTFYTFKMAMPQLSFSYEYSFRLGCLWQISAQGGNRRLLKWIFLGFAVHFINLRIYFWNFCNFACTLVNARKWSSYILFTHFTFLKGNFSKFFFFLHTTSWGSQILKNTAFWDKLN